MKKHKILCGQRIWNSNNKINKMIKVGISIKNITTCFLSTLKCVLKIYLWNLNRLSSRMYKKASLLSAVISVLRLDIITCLSETYLNSETSPDDGNLEISSYKLLEKITHLTLNVGDFAFFKKTHYLLSQLM